MVDGFSPEILFVFLQIQNATRVSVPGFIFNVTAA